jgi:membrane-bound lytic murein transglycosylase D
MSYLVRKRERTEAMLGRSKMYFPLFDQHLSEGKVPLELKHLAVVESALNPIAVSRAGAVGLWQFMPGTGREYGLAINGLLDERKDPIKATQAAAKYLQRLFATYQDWALALAAYNSGPGRVNAAIRRGASTNYWEISQYLPAETRNYVPAYIAAAYLINHYQSHKLVPEDLENDLLQTSTTTITDRISFKTIGELTGLPEELIAMLNPQFLKKSIPASVNGHNLTLPKRVMNQFLDKLPDWIQEHSKPGSKETLADVEELETETVTTYTTKKEYKEITYKVRSGDNLLAIAGKYDCSVGDIKKWNKLSGSNIRTGQSLRIRTMVKTKVPKKTIVPVIPGIEASTPKGSKKETPKNSSSPSEKTHSLNGLVLPVNTPSPEIKITPSPPPPVQSSQEVNYQYYILGRRESLGEVAAKFGVTLAALCQLNQWDPATVVVNPGDRIRIK